MPAGGENARGAFCCQGDREMEPRLGEGVGRGQERGLFCVLFLRWEKSGRVFADGMAQWRREH